jgi:pimeloyl-ACP methyl ester carboxylesterase
MRFSQTNQAAEKPSFMLLLAEMRAAMEFGFALAWAPVLLTAPRGDRHPVLVLPGFLAGDLSTAPLRRYLSLLGYQALPWKLGRNMGGFYRRRPLVRNRIVDIQRASGQKVSLIGWSLGGVFARDAALTIPDSVRQVITLGSPFSKDLTANNASALYERLTGESARNAKPGDVEALAGPLPVPTTAIFSKTDGVVNWKTSMLEESDTSENIEVLYGSHIGLGVNAAVLWAIADRLAMPEGKFRPFDRGGPFRRAYPRPEASGGAASQTRPGWEAAR